VYLRLYVVFAAGVAQGRNDGFAFGLLNFLTEKAVCFFQLKGAIINYNSKQAKSEGFS
jgi:hypothetical protein